MLGDSEYAFDAFRVANTNLNMSFGIKPRTVKYRSALKKDTANRINRSVIGLFPDVMQQSNDSTIKIAS